MEISKTRTIKINMGNYEHIEEFFRVTTNTDDMASLGIDTEGMTRSQVFDALSEFVNKKLDEETLSFIERVSKITACAESAALDPAFAKTFDPNPQPPAKATATAKKTTRRT